VGGVIVVERREDAERMLAREIADLVRTSGRVVLGIATGRTPAGIYRELARLHAEEKVDFRRVEAFLLDEYLDLAPDDARSFLAWTRERVLEPLGIPVAQARCPEAGEEYERAIREAGGVDLQILGIGRNGHVAFNEPGSRRTSRTRVVDLHPWTREDASEAFGGIDRVPRRAITMGIATILEAKRLRVLAFGSAKAQVVAQAFERPIGPEVPATYVREHRDLEVWLDREAASELYRTSPG
jgi:glucosamine-6-phosphate deaminase